MSSPFSSYGCHLSAESNCPSLPRIGSSSQASNLTLDVDGRDVLVIRQQVEQRIAENYPLLLDNPDIVAFIEEHHECLAFMRKTYPQGPFSYDTRHISLVALNESSYSNLIIECTFNRTEMTGVTSVIDIGLDAPIDSLKLSLRSVMEMNQTLGLRVMSWTEPHWETESPFVAYLWSYNYTGTTFWCWDAFTTIWSHDNADALLAGIHWEIATYRYIQQSVFPHGPFDVVTSETEIVFSVTPEGEVIKIEAGPPPPLDGASIHPLVPVGGIVLAALCIALVFRWARGRR